MITGQLLEESKVKYEMTTENIEKYIKNEEANGASKQISLCTFLLILP